MRDQVHSEQVVFWGGKRAEKALHSTTQIRFHGGEKSTLNVLIVLTLPALTAHCQTPPSLIMYKIINSIRESTTIRHSGREQCKGKGNTLTKLANHKRCQAWKESCNDESSTRLQSRCWHRRVQHIVGWYHRRSKQIPVFKQQMYCCERQC